MKTLEILVVSNSQESANFVKTAGSYTANLCQFPRKNQGKRQPRRVFLGSKPEILASETILKRDPNLIGSEWLQFMPQENNRAIASN